MAGAEKFNGSLMLVKFLVVASAVIDRPLPVKTPVPPSRRSASKATVPLLLMEGDENLLKAL
jgi:hypothetical protein